MSVKTFVLHHLFKWIDNNLSATRTLKSDCISCQKRRTLTMKWTHFYISCHLCLSEYGVEHGLEHTQELDVSCSSLSTIPYSDNFVTYVEYEHGVKARLEHGI